jgi:signal peptidase
VVRFARVVGNVLVWTLAVLGAVSVAIWGATQAGWIKPLVVISGSMEPGIMTGDLLVARPHATADLQVGEVASITSAVTGDIITHRVIAIEGVGDGTWKVNLKGDANDVADGETYVVGDSVWQPWVQVPAGGTFLVTLTKPSVAIPIGITVLAVLGLTLLPADERRPAEARAGRHSGDDLSNRDHARVEATKELV